MGGGIALDAAGNVYLAGTTTSRDFPLTNGAAQARPGISSADAAAAGGCYILKLNPAGNALPYSTYLGGSRRDACTAVAIDREGNAYVTGTAMSNDFPVTPDSLQAFLRFGVTSPPIDGFVAKLNASGTRLVYSTYFGGNGNEIGTAIAVDAAGSAYVTGFTNSVASFPVSSGAFQPRIRQTATAVTRPGVYDAFVLKLNPAGSEFVYGTYLGGSSRDMAFGIHVDAQSNAVVCPTGAAVPRVEEIFLRRKDMEQLWYGAAAPQGGRLPHGARFARLRRSS
jgi:hypothetical protein